MKVKLLNPNAVLPHYAKPGDAGLDLYSIENVQIPPKQRRVVRTGIAIELSNGYEAQIRPRSGLAAKYGITVLNSPGTIDSGYRGELMVIMYNTSDDTYIINVKDKIAQMVISKYEHVEFEITEELSETERGEGRFGHTG